MRAGAGLLRQIDCAHSRRKARIAVDDPLMR
jgi:hypothetical protein